MVALALALAMVAQPANVGSGGVEIGRKKYLFRFVAVALMVAFPAAAAEDWQRVAPGDAKVSVGLGWTKAANGALWVKWTPNYSDHMWVSSWQGGAIGFPRLEILVQEAGPGFHVRSVSKIGNEQITNWNFLSNKNIQIADRSSAAGYKTLYFKADDTKCVYFSKIGKPIEGGDISATSSYSGFVHGYYCPDQASDLTKADALAVIRSIRITD